MGHRCRAQKLYFLGGVLIEGDLDNEAEQIEEEAEGPSVVQTESSLEILLHAISGTLNLQTMRVKGSINRHSVKVLIDSGSTHNFIDSEAARKARLEIHKEGTMDVMVANGEKINSLRCCRKESLSVQGIAITTEFYLEGFEVVLDAYWLQTLGPILWDFSNLWMKFTLNGRQSNERRIT